MRRKQMVFAHQTQHTLTRGPYVAQNAQTGPYLTMPLGGERRAFQIILDGLQQGDVRNPRFGTAFAW